MPRKDKRTRERYNLRLPLKVTWEDRSGKEKRETTITQDVSFSGCFFVCRNCIEKGSRVNMEIDLSMAKAGITSKQVAAKGRVVRSVPMPNPEEGKFGHAVKFDKFRFPRG
jgi:hypothetical protein